MAINLIAEWPLGESEDKPMNVEQQQRNEKVRRFGIYMVHNSSHDTIVLPKNKLVGQCQLILQPSEEAYHQELSAMQQERLTKKQEEAYHQELSAMRQEKRPRNWKENKSSEEEQLSRDWVLDNFGLKDNPIMKENPEIGEELIQVL